MDCPSQEQDPFSIILCRCKTPILPPSWYHYPIPSPTANQKILKLCNKFIIYRSHMHAERRYAEHMDHAAGKRGIPERILCTQIAKDWGDMSKREKKLYSETAA
ncbi:hypothetical protein EWM64_g9261 [Hericium alpestre]|uniref:Uncharacterized protein n=1 Tax=Hericium alpestre TaxID=135208 RepID=A0A4Y9ZLQ5_9AGAM|nr:hypothetical protein EWM64_g9261 [Hericium alpestre]